VKNAIREAKDDDEDEEDDEDDEEFHDRVDFDINGVVTKKSRLSRMIDYINFRKASVALTY